MRIYTPLLFSLILSGFFYIDAHSQTCPKGSPSVNFAAEREVQIIACIQNEVGLGKQSVFWGARNLTNDKLYIKFIKVVYTICGSIQRTNGDTYLNPGAFVGGTTFSGEITFESQIWKEDCNATKNRISRVTYENLTIQNISQEERDKEAKRKDEEAKTEQVKIELERKEQHEKEEKERIEKEKKEKEEKEKIAEEKAAKEKEKKDAKDSKSSSDSTKGKSTSSNTYPSTESDYAREMRLRAETQRSKDAAEDQAMGNALAGTAGAMGLAMSANLDNDDEDDDLPIYLKGTIGLGLQQVPVTSNMTYGNNNYSTGATTYNYVSQKSSTNNYSINAGLLFAAFNDRFVSFRLSPFFTFGTNAFISGTTGYHMSYGSGVALGFGRKFKVLLKGEFVNRSGDMTEDNSGIGLDATGSTTYDYSTIKYGAGAYVGFGGHDAFVEVSAWRENVSFLKNIKAEVYSYEAKLSISILAFGIQYSPNYPIAGEVKYPGTYRKEKEDLLNFSIYVPFKIFSKY